MSVFMASLCCDLNTLGLNSLAPSKWYRARPSQRLHVEMCSGNGEQAYWRFKKRRKLWITATPLPSLLILHEVDHCSLPSGLSSISVNISYLQTAVAQLQHMTPMPSFFQLFTDLTWSCLLHPDLFVSLLHSFFSLRLNEKLLTVNSSRGVWSRYSVKSKNVGQWQRGKKASKASLLKHRRPCAVYACPWSLEELSTSTL